MNFEKPEIMISKREKWTAKVGTIAVVASRLGPAGTKYYMAYQKASGSMKHSGPAGKRANRFYPGRVKAKAKGK